MIQDLFNLKGENILITGSSRGIGFTLARGLGHAGATIILNGRKSESLQKASDRLKNEGINVHTSVFDVSDEEGQDVTKKSFKHITKDKEKLLCIFGNLVDEGENKRSFMKLAKNILN